MTLENKTYGLNLLITLVANSIAIKNYSSTNFVLVFSFENYTTK